MSKRTVTRRTAAEIDSALQDSSIMTVRENASVHRSAQRQKPREALGRVDAPADRLTRLKNYRPLKSAGSVAVVRDAVAELVLAVPFSSSSSDNTLIGHAYRLAIWCLHAKGSFDPVRDLQEATLEDFRVQALSDLAGPSQATYLSNLRRLRRRGVKLNGLARTGAKAPHSGHEWAGLKATVRHAGDRAADAEMLLVLTGGAGLRSEEVIRASGSWIEFESATKVNLLVPSSDGTFRTVPLVGEPARVLANWAHRHDGSDSLLFRPAFKNRTNAISSLQAQLRSRFPEWSCFNAVRARHMWLTQLFESPMPFHMICQIAGIGIDSNLPTDLLAHMQSASTNDIRRALRAGDKSSGKAA